MPKLQDIINKKVGPTSLAGRIAAKEPNAPFMFTPPRLDVPTTADPQDVAPPMFAPVEKRPKPVGFVESVKEEFQRPARGFQHLPISGGLVGTAENLIYLSAAQRIQQPDYDYSKPIREEPTAVPGVMSARPIKIYSSRGEDIKMLEELFIRTERQSAGYTFAGKVAKGVLNLPVWMSEFAMTGGLANLGNKVAQDAGVKLLGRYAKTKAGQIALRGAGWTGGAITRATLGLAPRITERATRRQVEVQLLGTRDEGWATSFAKAWGDITIEAASETAGQTITGVPVALLKRSKFGNLFISRLQSEWMRATGGTAGAFVRKMATKGGYSNLLGEMSEEWLGTTLRAITDVEDFGADEIRERKGLRGEAGITERLLAGLREHAKDVGVEAVVLSIPMAGQMVVGRAAKRFAPTEKISPVQQDVIDRLNGDIKAIEEEHGVGPKANELRKQRVQQAHEEYADISLESAIEDQESEAFEREVKGIAPAEKVEVGRDLEGQIRRLEDEIMQKTSGDYLFAIQHAASESQLTDAEYIGELEQIVQGLKEQPATKKPAAEGEVKTAFVSKNPKSGELPWRVAVLDEDGRVLYHTDHKTERMAEARLGALIRAGEVKQAQPPAKAVGVQQVKAGTEFEGKAAEGTARFRAVKKSGDLKDAWVVEKFTERGWQDYPFNTFSTKYIQEHQVAAKKSMFAPTPKVEPTPKTLSEDKAFQEELRRVEAGEELSDTSEKYRQLEDKLMELSEKDPQGKSAEYKRVDAKMGVMIDAHLARQKKAKPAPAKLEPLETYKTQVVLPNRKKVDVDYRHRPSQRTEDDIYNFCFRSKAVGLVSKLGVMHLNEKSAVVDAAGGPVEYARKWAEQRYAELEEATKEKPERKAEGSMKKYPPGKAANVEKQTGSDGAVYKVVEAADLIPSHHAIRFGKRKDYPEGVQERQYETDKTEQMKVIEAAGDFKAEFLINDNPDAINGPPIVDADGMVIGGNSRVMIIQRVYKTKPKSAARYKEFLRKKAEQFGVGAKAITKMKEPVLVRQLTSPPADVGDMHRLAREYNTPLTQGLSATADAVSRAKNLSEDTMDLIGVLLAKDESVTIRELLKGINNTVKITRSLQQDGVINEREINRYLDPRTNLLNEDGKTLIEKVLLGKVIDDAALLSNLPHNIQRKIERALPHLAKIKARGGKWSITENLKTALDGYAYWDKATQTLEDFLNFQADLFDESPIKKDPKAQAIIRLLETKNTREIKAAFAKYAEKAASDIEGQGVMFAEQKPSPEKVFGEVFGKPKKVEKPKGLFGGERPGFVYIPRAIRQTIRDMIHLGQHGIIPAQSRWKKLGLTGKKLVARALKAQETAQIRSSQANEQMHDVTKGLSRKEKATFGYAVNHIAWEKDPRPKRDKIRGYKLRKKPISKNQRKAAEKFLELADWGLQEYAGMGGVRRFKGGGAEPIMGGGIPWPQRFTKEGLELYAEVMEAKDAHGRPNFAALKDNALVAAMIGPEGDAGDVGHAWRILIRYQENQNRPLYGYFEKTKDPMPAKYLTFNSKDVLGHNFWLSMYRTIELARQFGIEHSRAFGYLGAIELQHGKGVRKEVENWFDRVTGKERMNLSEAKRAGDRMAHRLGAYQLLKLSPLTSAQNFFQRFLSLMEWGPVKTAPAMFTSYTKKSRLEARQAGAVPYDPFTAGVVGDLRTGEGRAFGRAWIEAIGMGITERQNNYTAAHIAAANVMKDLDELSKHRTKIGQVAKNLLSLGGDSPSAIQRRLRKHGINWKAAQARGYLTVDDLHLAALREAKSKHFRSDLFTTPTWWQQSPWARQFLKYKIPFAYNMLTQVGKLAATELAHGNLRPALAFLVVTCIAGEIYNASRGVLFGEDRSDLKIAKRILENLMDGGALGLFSSFMFGKDLIAATTNFIAGVWGKTIVNITRTTRNILEAPEHAPDHILQLIGREIPTWKYITNVVHRDEAKSRFQRQRIRYEAEKEFTKREGDRFYYYNDLYSAIKNKDKKEAGRVLKNLRRMGADTDSTMSALESRRPSRTSLQKRPEMLKSLNKAQLRMMAEEERDHDIIMGRAHDLIKGDYYPWLARQIQTAQSTKSTEGEKERARTRLRHLKIGESQYKTILRRAEKEQKKKRREAKNRPMFRR